MNWWRRTSYALRIKEPVLPEDPDSGDQTPLYNAYSGDGDVTGEVVYVNYGMPADFERLKEMNISVKGKIVLARYGAGWRGIKPKVALENGAIGCLIYSDPRDDGFFQGDVYPGGPYRPEYGAQRGSVMDMPIHPGDPLTPGWGSEAGGRKNKREDAPTILKIPVLPIGYGDALPILKQLKGPVAPQEWRGALPVTYHVGPGPAQLHMKLSFDWKNRPLHNVVVRIPGATRPDEWIIFGNHHDAWVMGADDPISGASALMETARGLGELLKTGWRPSRTIILALWDGEEWGLLGSTEWAEKHKAELQQKAVAYINTDGTGKGWLSAGGSHGLQQFLGEVTKDVMDPRTGKPIFEEARRRAILGEPEADRPAAEKDASYRIAPLGSGSDYTPFLQHLTLSALNVGFGGESPGGVYHSAYDTVKWYQTYSDTDYSYGRTLSQITGTLILRLSEAPVLPFQFSDTADTLMRYVDRAREAGRVQEGFEGRHEAGSQRRRRVAPGGPGVREGLRGVAQAEHRATTWPQGTAAAQQAVAHVGAETREHRGPAAPRVVQAPDVCARLLHRLRREDDAADSRRARREPIHRGARRRAHGVGRRQRARRPGERCRSRARAGSQVTAGCFARLLSPTSPSPLR